MTWHELSAAEAVRRLGVDPAAGLPTKEAARRRAEVGENALVGVLGAEVFAPFDVTLDLAHGFLELNPPAEQGSAPKDVPAGTSSAPSKPGSS